MPSTPQNTSQDNRQDNTQNPDELPNSEQAEQLPILWRDDNFVIINKPSGLLVHKSMIDRHETRFALQILRNQLGMHVFPIHRLDKPTSGALIFALSKEAARDFNARALPIEKEYLAVSRGFAPRAVSVNHPLREELDKICDKNANKDKPAQSALTAFYCLATAELEAKIERFPISRYSLVLCKPSTGRKHQIRRHLKHLSHPIIGDAKHGKGVHNRYFKDNLKAPRLLLHASKVDFIHPYSGETISVLAPLDNCMQQLLKKFKWLESIPAALALPQQASNSQNEQQGINP